MEAGNGGFCWLKVRFVRSCCLEVRFTYFRCVGAKRDASEMALVPLQGSMILDLVYRPMSDSLGDDGCSVSICE